VGTKEKEDGDEEDRDGRDGKEQCKEGAGGVFQDASCYQEEGGEGNLQQYVVWGLQVL